MSAAALAAPKHSHSATIDEAIDFYFANYGAVERPIIPALKRRFQLTSHQAVIVVREVTLRRARAA